MPDHPTSRDPSVPPQAISVGAPETTDEIGRIAGYRLLRLLGHGGMGVVCEAEDVQLRRRVAIKVMRPERAGSAEARERFLREARLTALLHHDNVVTVYQAGEDSGTVFLAMELLKGVSLEQWLARQPKPRIAQVVRIGRQIAEGLAAAHEAGLIHRDVKPANLWLEATQGGRVKILDFGLALPTQEVRLTSDGALLGTPLYLAPEQATGGAIDARADLFSLGCVLYRLCTGATPFAGKDVMQVLHALANHQPRPPHELNNEVPAALSALVMRLLAKRPGDRPRSALEVAAALAALEKPMAAVPPLPETVAVPSTQTLALPRPAARRWPLLAVPAALLAVIVTLWLAWPPKKQERQRPDDGTGHNGGQVVQQPDPVQIQPQPLPFAVDKPLVASASGVPAPTPARRAILDPRTSLAARLLVVGRGCGPLPARPMAGGQQRC
jgi:serine/threonine protein kinase